ncbi:MAG: 4Fe-4S dicluster domain-containing protein [Candidatus Hermodarchaeota archaeon]
MKSLLAIDVDKCTGCRNCELGCSTAQTKTFNPARSRITILKNEAEGTIVPMVCLQCEKALCVDACPTGAIVKNEHDILYVHSDDCIGCGNCVTACIYGGIEIDTITRKAIKCDLCWGQPACVEACDYGAIELVGTKADDFTKRARGISVLSPFYSHEEQEVEP